MVQPSRWDLGCQKLPWARKPQAKKSPGRLSLERRQTLLSFRLNHQQSLPIINRLFNFCNKEGERNYEQRNILLHNGLKRHFSLNSFYCQLNFKFFHFQFFGFKERHRNKFSRKKRQENSANIPVRSHFEVRNWAMMPKRQFNLNINPAAIIASWAGGSERTGPRWGRARESLPR